MVARPTQLVLSASVASYWRWRWFGGFGLYATGRRDLPSHS